MKMHSQEYAPWLLEGQTVDSYINQHINPMGSELEGLSVTVLKDVLLSHAGITLEILYLDRSEGDAANLHRFSPAVMGYEVGTIRLLYRP
jgi:ubiquitin thioesterase protein OTUB1